MLRLINNKCETPGVFEWQSQLKFRWPEPDSDEPQDLYINICDAQFASSQLVPVLIETKEWRRYRTLRMRAARCRRAARRTNTHHANAPTTSNDQRRQPSSTTARRGGRYVRYRGWQLGSVARRRRVVGGPVLAARGASLVGRSGPSLGPRPFRSLPVDATPHTQASLLLVWVGIRGWDCAREISPFLPFPPDPL